MTAYCDRDGERIQLGRRYTCGVDVHWVALRFHQRGARVEIRDLGSGQAWTLPVKSLNRIPRTTPAAVNDRPQLLDTGRTPYPPVAANPAYDLRQIARHGGIPDWARDVNIIGS